MDDDFQLLRDLCNALGWDFFHGPADHPFEATIKAEAEIARRGLLEEYADVLSCNLGAYVLPVSHQPPSIDYAALGVLITAPPEARVRAMLEVLKG